jgi:PAS domain S-box-containing protein
MSEPTSSERTVNELYDGAIWKSVEFRNFLDSMTEGFIAYDRDYRIVFLNKSFEQQLSPYFQEILGKLQWDLWPETLGSSLHEALEQTFLTGVGREIEFNNEVSGSWIDARIERRGSYLHVFVRSTTIAKRAEQAAKNADAMSRAIVSGMAAPVIVFDQDGTVLASNEAWLDAHSGVGRAGESVSDFEKRLIVLSIDRRDVVRDKWPYSRAAGAGPNCVTVRLKDRESDRELVLTNRAVPMQVLNRTVTVVTAEDITELFRAQEDLGAAERWLSTILGNVPCLIFALDNDGVFTFSDGSTLRDIGRVPGESVGTSIFDMYAGNSTVCDNIRICLQGVPMRYLAYVRDMVFEVTVNPLFDREGSQAGVIGVAVNITERIRSEEAIKQSEERYRFMTEANPHVVWTADRDGEKDYFNRRMEEVTGVPVANLLGENCWSVIPDDDAREMKAQWNLCRQTRSTYDIEHRVMTASGDCRWFRSRAVPMLDADGEVLKWYGVSWDIDDQREADRKMHIIHRVGRTLAEDLDLDRIVQALTDASVEIAEACCGKYIQWDHPANEPFPDWITAGAAPVRLEDVQGDPRLSSHLDEEHFTSGCESIRSFMMVPVLSRSGDRLGGIYLGHTQPGIFTEAHEQLVAAFAAQAAVALDNAKLYARVREMNDDLEKLVQERTAELTQINQDLEGFTYSVSHDLRAPLRAIVMGAAILSEEFGHQLPERAKAELRRQSNAALKLGNLIDDLLQRSRIGRQAMHRRSIDLSRMARELVIGMDVRNCTFEIEDGIRADADSVLLQLALANLFDNAVKYSPNGGIVRFGRRGDPDNEIFFVSDQGIGFEMLYHDKIFELFERLHRDVEFPGTGIGLANVKRIVERHGGKIWAKSALGEGSTFYFTLHSFVATI